MRYSLTATILPLPASEGECTGCAGDPSSWCAACGGPARLATSSTDGHCFPWCDQCHALLLSLRPARAAPLVYVPLPQEGAA
jgi:hypothetical protein